MREKPSQIWWIKDEDIENLQKYNKYPIIYLMEKHEQIHRSVKQIFLNNMLGGVAWGIGATVGASILLSLLGIALSRLDFIPVVGNFVLSISEFVKQNSAR